MIDIAKKYIVYFCLFISIGFILFVDRSNLGNETSLDFNGEIITLKEIDNINYIKVNDLKNIISNCYYDKVSLKLIITSENQIYKYWLNSKLYSENFIERENEYNCFIKNDELYFSLNEVARILDKDMAYSDLTNNYYLFDKNIFTGETNNIRTVVQFDINKTSRVVLNKKTSVNILDETDDYYKVKIDFDNQLLVGYIRKKEIEVKNYVNKQNNIQEDTAKFQAFFVDGNSVVNGALPVISTMFKLNTSNGNVILVNSGKNYDNVKYVAITNGYMYANYDSKITSTVLSADNLREQCIIETFSHIKDTNVQGVVFNFRNLKESDKDNYLQFLKEARSYAHSINKEVIVYVPYGSSYIDLNSALVVSDYVIYTTYDENISALKTSTYETSLKWFKDMVNMLENKQKVFLEIPLFSILWIEKNGVVISTERYNMKAVEDFLQKNNVNIERDNITDMDYICYNKGSLTYKMWLENYYSIQQKIKYSKASNVLGVVLYKEGDETNTLIDYIKEVTNE